MVFDSLSEPPVTAEMRSWEKRHRRALVTVLCSSVQLSSGSVISRLSVTVDRSTPAGLPVHHQPPQVRCHFLSLHWGAGVSGTHQAVRHKLGPLLPEQSPVRGRVCSEPGNASRYSQRQRLGALHLLGCGPPFSSPILSPLLHSSLCLSPCSWLPSLSHSLPISSLLLLSSRFRSFRAHSLSTLLCAWTSLNTEDAVSE